HQVGASWYVLRLRKSRRWTRAWKRSAAAARVEKVHDIAAGVFSEKSEVSRSPILLEVTIKEIVEQVLCEVDLDLIAKLEREGVHRVEEAYDRTGSGVRCEESADTRPQLGEVPYRLL